MEEDQQLKCMNEEFENLKHDINVQLAVNGFIKPQFIATRTDYARPLISENPTIHFYTNMNKTKKLVEKAEAQVKNPLL